MSLPDLSTKKGINAASTACGSGMTILLSSYINTFHPESTLQGYFTPEVAAILTGLFSFLSMLIINIFVKLSEEITYQLNHKNLKKLRDQYPQQPEIAQQLENLNAIRAKKLGKM